MTLKDFEELIAHETSFMVPALHGFRMEARATAGLPRYTKEFLDAYLQNDQKALAYLVDSPTGQVPPRLMMTSFRPSSR
jgi:hypothetical protein